MMIRTSALSLIAGGCLLVASVGCDNDSPAERRIEDAGNKIENAAENAGDRVEKAADRAGEKLENASDRVREAAD